MKVPQAIISGICLEILKIRAKIITEILIVFPRKILSKTFSLISCCYYVIP